MIKLLRFIAMLCFLCNAAYAHDNKFEDRILNPDQQADTLVRMSNLTEYISGQVKRDSLEKYAKITYNLAKKENNAEQLLRAANQLAAIYEEKGDLRQALQYYKSARDAENAIHKESFDLGLLRTEQLKTEYTAKHVEALAHQQEESRKSTLMIVGIFTLAVVSKTFLLYIIIRRKKSHNKELRILLDQVERQNLQLDEGYRFKQHLISVVAHDLRTPIASIISLLKLFEDGYLSENETRDMLQKARKEMDTLKKFLDETLTWIVGQRDGLRSILETFSISQMLDETVDIYRRRAEKKGIHFNVESMPDTFVRADKQMIKITVNNLLNNALKFCAADDHIYVSAKSETGGKIRVTIRDTGVGFDTKIDRKLTELSQKGILGTWGEKATGIGLSLCILYLHVNNTHLNLKSEPGKGAEFWFDLDMASEQMQHN
ncbi:HAMP domain-containing histidine kinase [Sphingobacterium sp. lm-10]|uniref:sensor histidine kinase n=1 Tax=Sphingobacterium sp. lm-10 TaxID=2944904 RepID=UPI00202162AA|nr:HAMP domain-containing sensor histidine kinase [Sphingobacterium sp. lm-10]MCL7986567.1 HAMP domain-containing histidine kinase [Sphingobacterium sp. lm-10]